MNKKITANFCPSQLQIAFTFFVTDEKLPVNETSK